MKKLLKDVVPPSLRKYYTKLSTFILRQKNNRKPASQVFSDIYANNRWGGTPGEFYSGPGSEGLFADQFCFLINRFIVSLKKDTVYVVDVGCGDFKIGSKIASENVHYTGIDVVPGLAQRNQEKYGSHNITFMCLDAASEPLPDGDVCIVKQVFQHLSNSQIASILEKTKKYPYIFVVESYPLKVAHYNKDKVHGLDTRFAQGSAVDLQKHPFNVANAELVMDIPWGSEERIKTFLIKHER